jgi:PAS domain S-box-containing protein
LDPYRSIFENAIEGIFQTTPSGQYISVNPALAKMYGYDSTDDLIRHLTRIDNQLYVDPARRNEFVAAMRQDGVVRGFESEVYRKDGSIIWISENARVVFDEDGEISYYEGMVEDISERKRLEQDMSRVHRQMHALLESAGDGIFGLDPEGRCTFINRAGAAMLGYSSGDVLGRSMHELIHHHHEDGREYSAAASPILHTFRSNRPCRVNHEVFWHADGRCLPVEYTCYPIIEHGVTNGAVITFSDITERKRHEEQIAEQAALLDKAQDAIVVCDLGGVILFWNKGAESIYELGRGEAVGRYIGQLLYPDPQEFEEVKRLALHQGEWSGEILHRTQSGRELNVQSRCTLVRDKQGEAKSILAINTDVTEKKRIEAQFMRAQRMESIGTLAGGIAHDLNNILTPIMMSLEVLKAKATDPQSKNILETIEMSSRRGAAIVRQVLSFARGMDGERVEIQPRHLLKDIDAILKNTFPKNIRLELLLPHHCWTVLGDTTQLHQVLLNLCVNARDAMPEGGKLAMSLENVSIDEHYAAMDMHSRVGKYVVIKVADSGLGIPAEIIDKIFDPFFTTKEVGKGTGLGLSTVMAIVKSHEGFVNVYSELGHGTTFKVYLPASDVSGEGAKQHSGRLITSRGKGEMVLVIDDEVSILNITSQTLQAFGYRVLTATDGAKALDIYRENRDEIALVLTDMSMPNMDGATVIRTLMGLNPMAKIIATSGLSIGGNPAPALELGVQHFLPKPYTAATLLKTVGMVLEKTAVPPAIVSS